MTNLNLLDTIPTDLRNVIFSYLYENGYADYLKLKSSLYPCYICVVRFNYRIQLTYHLRSKTHLYRVKYDIIICNNCGVIFTSYKRLLNHANSDRCPNLIYLCEICETIQRYKNRNRHYIKYHRLKTPNITPIKDKLLYDI